MKAKLERWRRALSRAMLNLSDEEDIDSFEAIIDFLSLVEDITSPFPVSWRRALLNAMAGAYLRQRRQFRAMFEPRDLPPAHPPRIASDDADVLREIMEFLDNFKQQIER